MTTTLESRFEEVRERALSLLEQRAEAWPVRPPELVEQSRRETAELWRIVRDAAEPVDHSPADQWGNEWKSRPIIICGSMKSGSSLLVQLFDGHPELIVPPGDSHLTEYLPGGKWHDAPAEVLLEHWVRRMFNPTGQPPYFLLGAFLPAYICFLSRACRHLATERRDRAPALLAFVAAFGEHQRSPQPAARSPQPAARSPQPAARLHSSKRPPPTSTASKPSFTQSRKPGSCRSSEIPSPSSPRRSNST